MIELINQKLVESYSADKNEEFYSCIRQIYNDSSIPLNSPDPKISPIDILIGFYIQIIDNISEKNIIEICEVLLFFPCRHFVYENMFKLIKVMWMNPKLKCFWDNDECVNSAYETVSEQLKTDMLAIKEINAEIKQKFDWFAEHMKIFPVKESYNKCQKISRIYEIINQLMNMEKINLVFSDNGTIEYPFESSVGTLLKEASNIFPSLRYAEIKNNGKFSSHPFLHEICHQISHDNVFILFQIAWNTTKLRPFWNIRTYRNEYNETVVTSLQQKILPRRCYHIDKHGNDVQMRYLKGIFKCEMCIEFQKKIDWIKTNLTIFFWKN